MKKSDGVVLDTLELEAVPRYRGGPDKNSPVGSRYTVFDLRVRINGRDLISNGAPLKLGEDLIAFDDSQLWLAQRYDRRSWLLTCGCGTPECAGFWQPIATRRQKDRLIWTFPESYFSYLRDRGLASRGTRPVTFTFDAQAVYDQFEAAQKLVMQQEAQSGRPSAFSAGVTGEPYYRLAEQYAHDEAWFLRRHKHRRYARHVGWRTGVCAGAQSTDIGENL